MKKSYLTSNIKFETSDINKKSKDKIIFLKKTLIMTWWTLFGVAITFLTLFLAGAFKKKK